MVDRYDEQLLLGYVEGDLTPEQAAEFERLLKLDPKLRQLAVQLHADRDGLRKIPSQNPGPELMERVEQQLERHMLLEPTDDANRPGVGKKRLKIVHWITYTGVAAMILLAGGLVLRTLVDSDVINSATGKNAASNHTSLKRSLPLPGELALSKDRDELLGDARSKPLTAAPSDSAAQNAPAKAAPDQTGLEKTAPAVAVKKSEGFAVARESAVHSEPSPAALPPQSAAIAAETAMTANSANITTQRQESGGALQRSANRAPARSEATIHVTTNDPAATAKFIANWITENQITPTDTATTQPLLTESAAPAADENADSKTRRMDVAKLAASSQPAAQTNATLGIAGFSEPGKMLLPLRASQITQLLAALNALPDHAANVQPSTLDVTATNDKTDKLEKNQQTSAGDPVQLVPVILEMKKP